MSYVYTELTMRDEEEQKTKQTKLLTYPLKKVCGMGMFGLFHKSYIPKHENKACGYVCGTFGHLARSFGEFHLRIWPRHLI